MGEKCFTCEHALGPYQRASVVICPWHIVHFRELHVSGAMGLDLGKEAVNLSLEPGAAWVQNSTKDGVSST